MSYQQSSSRPELFHYFHARRIVPDTVQLRVGCCISLLCKIVNHTASVVESIFAVEQEVDFPDGSALGSGITIIRYPSAGKLPLDSGLYRNPLPSFTFQSRRSCTVKVVRSCEYLVDLNLTV